MAARRQLAAHDACAVDWPYPHPGAAASSPMQATSCVATGNAGHVCVVASVVLTDACSKLQDYW